MGLTIVDTLLLWDYIPPCYPNVITRYLVRVELSQFASFDVNSCQCVTTIIEDFS